MPPKSFASGDAHLVVPMALLCVLCATATFASVMYAIAARADIEALSARLSSIESRGCCVSSNQAIKKTDDNSPRLPDNVAEEGQSSASQELHNGMVFGEGSLESPSNPILPTQDNSSDAWSALSASQEHLQPKRESRNNLHPASVLHVPNEWKNSNGSSDIGEVTKNDAIEGQYALPQQIFHGTQIRNRFRRSSPQNREFMNEDEIEDISRPERRRGGGGRRRGGARDDPVLRGHRITGSTHTLALHFGGNTSKYSLGHRHYAGNGRLRHPDGIFRDWKIKEWSGRFDRQHRIHENDGTLTIRESGIYFVYAQVYYLDDHDVNGFLVLVNESPVLQCTTMTHGGERTKANTCFTGGMVELHAGDTILLKDVEALRYSIFEPEKSFFGLFRVAHHTTGPREGL